MTRSAAFALLLLGLAAPASGQGGTAARVPGPSARSPFPMGERLQYEVIWGFVRLGTAQMTVEGIDTIRGKPAVHVRFRIQGNHYLYRMDNSMDSWISLADTSSLRFRQDNNENGKVRHAYYEILPDSGYYRQEGIDSLKPTSPRPLDDAAFFYFVRTTPLEAGKRYEFDRYFRPDRNPVILDSLVKDTLDLKLGRFPSIKLTPIIKGRGILAEASEARMWLSDDDRRILVQLKSKFPYIGYLTLRLFKIDTIPAARNSAR
ncbi:MAG: DUF3108 domain-containing protein [Gemmatimonadetes bacterium]|nr:DUF3108 domain-containing protein [Gemmatimonadota bacterium]